LIVEPRPYYHRFGWAYDLLNAEPIEARIQFVVAELERRDVRPPDQILDAGCGTGRYAIDLSARGFRVSGVDQSPELIEIAQRQAATLGFQADFSVANLLNLEPARKFNGVLCRGVLNDFLTDADRDLVFRRFAQWLVSGGVLILDARDWARTTVRYRAKPASRREISLPDDGLLIFESSTSLDAVRHQLIVREVFEHRCGKHFETTENMFAMRCWSREEIADRLAGDFENIAVLANYGKESASWSDRLVVVASRAKD
jgi:SAM-dependent methyltransferase